jgi:outer membrane protein OmpA-like peptidoglycan-associated protein
MKHRFLFALPLAATLIIPAMAQTSSTPTDNQQPAATSTQNTGSQSSSSSDMQSTPNSQTSKDDLSARQPLKPETHQGFWGKMNPFARKKYVARQLDPIRNRVNELDELTSKNSNMLKDVDARATEGIRMASAKANEADQHAVEAGTRAQTAHQTAEQANTRLQTVEQVVGNIDQYQPATQTEIRFRSGQSVLSQKAKDALDEMATNLKDQKGYIIEVQGFSPGKGQAALASSQNMADSVVRYLVLNHEIPVYRIFVLGMGNVPQQTAEGKKTRLRTGRVDVALLKNNLEQLSSTQSAGAGMESAPASTQGGTTGTAQQSGTEPATATQPSGIAAPSQPQTPSQQQTPATQQTPPPTTEQSPR